MLFLQKGSSLFKNYQPNQIAGIDLFIAAHENRGQGLGVVIINQFINEFLSHFRLLVVDPNHDNIQAIRCYEKSGFEHSDYSEDLTYCIMLKSIEKR
jgi:aminoglycoside 6'-N-acetyltransferase